MNKVLFIAALVSVIVSSSLAWTTSSPFRGKGISSSVSMLFGGNKKKTLNKNPFTVKVDGKPIVSETKGVNLRKLCQENKIDVYPFKAKFSGNCGGAGICGTCAVKVLKGDSNFSKKSKNEMNTLRDKPADFRLSCCSKLSGPVEIKTKVW